MKKLTVIFILGTALICGGCQIPGILGTPTRHEKKIPAEYDLTEHIEQKILVLVEQPAYLNAQTNLRYYITDAMNRDIVRRIKIEPEMLVDYSELSHLRSGRSHFAQLSKAEVGKALGADMVLYVDIDNYQLRQMPDEGYLNGFLSGRALLLETATGEKLWPVDAKSKSIKVGFDVENRGKDIAVKRLAMAFAYCTVRYLYDCPESEFKLFDDRSGIQWQKWERKD